VQPLEVAPTSRDRHAQAVLRIVRRMRGAATIAVPRAEVGQAGCRPSREPSD
jgi:hypothetical protein